MKYWKGILCQQLYMELLREGLMLGRSFFATHHVYKHDAPNRQDILSGKSLQNKIIICY